MTETDIVERLRERQLVYVLRDARDGENLTPTEISPMEAQCNVETFRDAAAEILSLRTSLEEAIRERDEARTQYRVLLGEYDDSIDKAIEDCAKIVDAVRVEFVAAGAAIVESGMAHEIMPEAVSDNLKRIAKSIRALNGGGE